MTKTMREALEASAATFRRYEALHAAKIEPMERDPATPPGAIGATIQKAEANREMAEMCEAALASEEPREATQLVEQFAAAIVGTMMEGGKPSESEWVANTKARLLAALQPRSGSAPHHRDLFRAALTSEIERMLAELGHPPLIAQIFPNGWHGESEGKVIDLYELCRRTFADREHKAASA